MNVVLLLVRTRLRSSWRAALVLVVLVGLGGGVTLAVAAGARRTAAANEAIMRAANAPDAATSYADQHPDEVLSLLEDIPGIDALSILVGFAGRLEGTGRPASTLYFLGLRTDQPRVDRPFVLAGRLPTGPDEVLLNEGAATRTGRGWATLRRSRSPTRPTSAFSARSPEGRSRSWGSGCSLTR